MRKWKMVLYAALAAFAMTACATKTLGQPTPPPIVGEETVKSVLGAYAMKAGASPDLA